MSGTPLPTLPARMRSESAAAGTWDLDRVLSQRVRGRRENFQGPAPAPKPHVQGDFPQTGWSLPTTAGRQGG